MKKMQTRCLNKFYPLVKMTISSYYQLFACSLSNQIHSLQKHNSVSTDESYLWRFSPIFSFPINILPVSTQVLQNLQTQESIIRHFIIDFHCTTTKSEETYNWVCLVLEGYSITSLCLAMGLLTLYAGIHLILN
jgi:hypothetical protein